MDIYKVIKRKVAWGQLEMFRDIRDVSHILFIFFAICMLYDNPKQVVVQDATMS